MFSHDHLQIRIPSNKRNGGPCASIEPCCCEISFMWLDLNDDKSNRTCILTWENHWDQQLLSKDDTWLLRSIFLSVSYLPTGNADLKMYKHWGVKADGLFRFKEIFDESALRDLNAYMKFSAFFKLSRLCRSVQLYFGPRNNTTMLHIVNCVEPLSSSRPFGFN